MCVYFFSIMQYCCRGLPYILRNRKTIPSLDRSSEEKIWDHRVCQCFPSNDTYVAKFTWGISTLRSKSFLAFCSIGEACVKFYRGRSFVCDYLWAACKSIVICFCKGFYERVSCSIKVSCLIVMQFMKLATKAALSCILAKYMHLMLDFCRRVWFAVLNGILVGEVNLTVKLTVSVHVMLCIG